MEKGRPLLALFLLILISFSPVVDSQFDELADCMTDAFVNEMGQCFLEKFSALLPASTQEQQYGTAGFSTGRHLQSLLSAFPPHSQLDRIPRQKAGELTMKKMGKSHRSLISNLVAAKQLALSGQREGTPLFNQLKHLDFKQMMQQYFQQLALHSIPENDAVRSALELGLRINEHSLKKNPRSSGSHSPEGAVPPASKQAEGDPPCRFPPINQADRDCWRNSDLFLNLQELIEIGICLSEVDEADFEDGLSWLHCLYRCSDLPQISSCVQNTFTNSTSQVCQDSAWISDFVTRGFTDFVNLTDCYFEVVEPEDLSVPISLVEGGETVELKLRPYLPPEVICLGPHLFDNGLGVLIDVLSAAFSLGGPCVVQIEMSSSNYMHGLLPRELNTFLGIGRPKCQNGDLIKQILIGEHPSSPENFGIINVTNDNWMEFQTVPLSAAIDHHADDTLNISFTLKMVVDGSVQHSRKIPITVVNRDVDGAIQCYSVNDPHINTFDNFYYNNLYHGYFYMYKHASLPYEVQVVYQACNTTTQQSCSCAVAVKSGDDVIVVDRCRRTSEACVLGDCTPILDVTLFVNGQITPGTRVFRMDGGLRHDILLPHGTLVRTAVNGDLLNIWIMPSSYDRDRTSGLCGTYNADQTDDLTFPNGTVYAGPGDQEREQPRPFSLAWRVPEQKRIFQGAAAVSANDTFKPMKFCHCHYVVFEGADCTCGYDVRVETCDLRLYGEYSSVNISAITKPSRVDQGTSLPDVEIDETYNPPDLTWTTGGVWDQPTAEDFCHNQISGSEDPAISNCQDLFGNFKYPGAEYSCEEDILITGDTRWLSSAVQNAKYSCRAFFERVVATRFDIDDIEAMVNGTCLNDCNQKGACNRGVCECHVGHAGPDCSLPAGTQPVVVLRDTEMCDSRQQDCVYATVLGRNFLDTSNLECRVKPVQVTSGGTEDAGSSWVNADVIIISPNQAACSLPRNGSYQVELFAEGQKVNTQRMRRSVVTMAEIQWIYVAVDTACYTCSGNPPACHAKTSEDYCLVNGYCYQEDQLNPADSCQYCRPTSSQQGWTDVPGESCDVHRAEALDKANADQKDRTIRISLAVSLTALIIIIVIIMFCVQRYQDKKKKSTSPDEAKAAHTNQETGDGKNAYINPTLTMDDCNPAMQTADPNPGIRPTDSKQLEQLRQEARQRTDSVGSQHSVRSVGIGGHLGPYASPIASSNLGIGGGHMPPPKSEREIIIDSATVIAL